MSEIRQVYGDRYNHFVPPPVIELTGGVRSGRKYNIDSARGRKLKLIERDGATCRYCGSSETLTIEHLTPKSRGGSNALENLALSCYSCNHKKANLTDSEFLDYCEKNPDCRLCGLKVSGESFLAFVSYCSHRCKVRCARLLTEVPIFATLVLDAEPHLRKTYLLALKY